MKKLLAVFVFIIVLFWITACKNNMLFDEVQSIETKGWEAEKVINFTFIITDTTKYYDLYFHLRNDKNYTYSNIWLFAETTSPTGNTLLDTLEFQLAEPTGKWLGAGLGDINSMLLPYKINVLFPYRGIYKLSLQQGMREQVLQNILDVGLRVKEHQP